MRKPRALSTREMTILASFGNQKKLARFLQVSDAYVSHLKTKDPRHLSALIDYVDGRGMNRACRLLMRTLH